MRSTDVQPPAAATTDPAPVRTTPVIGILVVAAFVALFNETLLTVALPTLTREFSLKTTTTQWVTSGFLLTMAVVIPTTGFLLRRFTTRALFIAALSLFTSGTLLAGAAPVFGLLIAGRVVQAGGTALVVPLLITTILRLVPAERRGATMGTVSLVIAAAPAIGPTIGGLVLDTLGWRYLFFCVAPLGVVMLVVGILFLKVPSSTSAVKLDLLSVALSALAFGGIIYGFATISQGPDATVSPLALIGAGLLALAAFVLRQLRLQRRDAALLDLRPFTIPQFRITLVVAALVFMVLLGVASLLLPLYLQLGVRVTPGVAGLAVLPGGLLLALLGRPVGRLYDRYGPRPLLIPGALVITAATFGFALLSGPSLATVIALHIVLCLGLALMMTPLLTHSTGVLPFHLYSFGSAIVTTSQQLAGAASAAVLVTAATALSAANSVTPDAGGLRGAFLAVGCVCGLIVILATRVRKSRSETGH